MKNEKPFSCCEISTAALRFVLLLVVAGIIAAGMSARSFAIPPPARFELKSDPAGASVFLNNRLVPRGTPLVLCGLDYGTYSLRLEKQGYTPVQRKVVFGKDGLSVDEKMNLLPASEMTVEVKPDGSDVLLDGELIGQTPLHVKDLTPGPHELLVRKTNFSPYSKHLDVVAGQAPLVFKDFSLDDMILRMLKGNIAKESWRVMYHMDLGHYLFVNDHLKEAAEAYGKAIAVAAEPLDNLPKETTNEERQLQARLRSEDRGRLSNQVSIKEHWPGKDVKAFTEAVEAQRRVVNDLHIKEAGWVLEQVGNYYNNGQNDDAEALVLKHMNALGDPKLLEQAHLSLLAIRIRQKKLPTIQEAFAWISSKYPDKPDLLRQAGDAIYNANTTFDIKQRPEFLAMADKAYHAAIAGFVAQKNVDYEALCRFQLGVTLDAEGHGDQAIPFFHQAIDATKDEASKEARTQRLAECYKTLKNFQEACKLLDALAKSPREPVASKAKQELKEIASLLGGK